jgi:hypothetical protein
MVQPSGVRESPLIYRLAIPIYSLIQHLPGANQFDMLDLQPPRLPELQTRKVTVCQKSIQGI